MKKTAPRYRKEDYELLAEFRYRLRRFLRFSEQAAMQNGLTPQQYQVLLAIQGYPGRHEITMSELAERLQINHHSAVGLVDRLEAAGFVRRAPAPDDRRKVLLRLTPEGLAIMDATYGLHRDALRTLGPQLTELLQQASELPSQG